MGELGALRWRDVDFPSLQTEPWLFTFDREGRLGARLESSFGVRGFEEAIKAAL
jgi:hypothetical protein